MVHLSVECYLVVVGRSLPPELQKEKWQKWRGRAAILFWGTGAVGLIGLVAGLNLESLTLSNLEFGITLYGILMVAGALLWAVAALNSKRADQEIRNAYPRMR